MIKIAQIGCGYWGPNLLRNFSANSRCEVSWVCDFASERREYVRRYYPSVRTTDDPETIFNDPDVAGVVVATPAATHHAYAMRALEAGKHVLVEKPMAQTVQEVRDIRAAAEARGLVAMVGHTFLYNGAVRYLKELIDSGGIGDLRYIYSQRLNLGRIRSDVDALWNFAPHDVSIIQYLLDDADPSQCFKVGTDFVQPGIEDVVFLNILYPGKVMAHVHVSWLDPVKVRKMIIVGSEKMVCYDDISENKITVFDKGIDKMARLGENMDFDAPNFVEFNHRSGDIVMPRVPFLEPLKVETDHFLDCIIDGVPCISGAAHAERVVGILSAGKAGAA